MTAPSAAPATLFWGEDPFLLREAALELLGDVRPAEVEAAEWQGGELSDLATPSLFGERRALLVNDARSLTAEALAEIASYLAGDPDPDAPLIICCQVAERGRPPAGLEKAVRPVGAVTQVAIPRKDLEMWLVQRAKRQDLALSPPAARALVDALGDDAGRLVAALDQMASAFSGMTITPQLVSEQFRGLGEQKVWDLCDKAFTKDLPGAVRSLRSIEDAGDEPLMVLGGIAARLRDLIRVRSLPDKLPLNQVAKAAGLRYDWQARRYRQQAANFSMAQLLTLHERVGDVDRALKSGSSGDVVMPMLITQIAAN
jgi:DNA polymerase III subunit delta